MTKKWSELLGRILIDEGYEVTLAASAREARTLTGPWDLLLTDVVMPETDGVKLSRELDVRRVIFISGYDQEALVDTDSSFLQKPFSREELARAVRALFDERAADGVSSSALGGGRRAGAVVTNCWLSLVVAGIRAVGGCAMGWTSAFKLVTRLSADVADRRVGRRLTDASSSPRGRVERSRRGRDSAAGRARRSQRSSSRASAARPCSARRTRSWRRRSPRSPPARGSSSSTATARTSACRSPTSRQGRASTGRGRRSSCTSAVTSRSTSSGSPSSAARRDLPDRGLRPRARRRRGTAAGPGLGRRRRLVVRRDEDDLDRRGRHARLAARGRCSSSRARSATTASPSTPSTG